MQGTTINGLSNEVMYYIRDALDMQGGFIEGMWQLSDVLL